jgi:hypothetical protein
VPDHPDQRWEDESEEDRVRLDPGDEINQVLHNGFEYNRLAPDPNASCITASLKRYALER